MEYVPLGCLLAAFFITVTLVWLWLAWSDATTRAAPPADPEDWRERFDEWQRLQRKP